MLPVPDRNNQVLNLVFPLPDRIIEIANLMTRVSDLENQVVNLVFPLPKQILMSLPSSSSLKPGVVSDPRSGTALGFKLDEV